MVILINRPAYFSGTLLEYLCQNFRLSLSEKKSRFNHIFPLFHELFLRRLHEYLTNIVECLEDHLQFIASCPLKGKTHGLWIPRDWWCSRWTATGGTMNKPGITEDQRVNRERDREEIFRNLSKWRNCNTWESSYALKQSLVSSSCMYR